jgi:hypothetical protein
MNFTLNENSEIPTVFLEGVLLTPECFNFIFLVLGLYEMYNGIEIQHPLYATVYLNLMVALLFTTIDLISLIFLSVDKFVTLSKQTGGFTVLFHCSTWCISSAICYIYIVHNDWIYRVIPMQQKQCYYAIGFSFILFVLLLLPPYGYSIYLGR